MNIEIVVGENVVKAHLEDNAAARDFAALLPLELKLDDYGSIEKVSDLPKSLSKQGAPTGYAAKKGDITYYAPWGNLAIFLKDFSYASGLVYLGSVDENLAALAKSGKLPVVIREAE